MYTYRDNYYYNCTFQNLAEVLILEYIIFPLCVAFLGFRVKSQLYYLFSYL